MDWQRLTWVWDSERLTWDLSSATASRPKKCPWPVALSTDVNGRFKLWHFPNADNLRRIGQDLHWTSRLLHRRQQRVRGRTQHVKGQKWRGAFFSQTWQAKRSVNVWWAPMIFNRLFISFARVALVWHSCGICSCGSWQSRNSDLVRCGI